MIDFKKRILFVGFGGVAECTLPILFKHIKVPAKNVTVMDFAEVKGKLKKWTAKGVHHVRNRVTPENMGTLLGKYLGAGDLLIDLAWNIDALEILTWCRDHGVLYINTSTELWDPYDTGPNAHPTTKTLYWRHMNLRRLMAKWDTPESCSIAMYGRMELLSHDFARSTQ